MKTIIGLVLGTLAAFALALAVRLGAFKTVEVRVADEGPFKLVYKEHIGPYHKIISVIEDVEKWARANREKCSLSFGEYLDDPNTTAEDRLRSHGGCVVDRDWVHGLAGQFTFRQEPRRLYVVAEFSGAPSLGPLKIYPKARSIMREKGLSLDGPVLEIYEVLPEQKVRTRYLFPARPVPTKSEANDTSN